MNCGFYKLKKYLQFYVYHLFRKDGLHFLHLRFFLTAVHFQVLAGSIFDCNADEPQHLNCDAGVKTEQSIQDKQQGCLPFQHTHAHTNLHSNKLAFL